METWRVFVHFSQCSKVPAAPVKSVAFHGSWTVIEGMEGVIWAAVSRAFYESALFWRVP
jgi:hypothetical protein